MAKDDSPSQGFPKRLARRLALAAGGITFTLVLLEAALRAFPPPISDRLFEPNDRFGWFHIPNRRGSHRTAEFSTLVSINSLCLREIEHIYLKPNEVYRILILGDSFP